MTTYRATESRGSHVFASEDCTTAENAWHFLAERRRAHLENVWRDLPEGYETDECLGALVDASQSVRHASFGGTLEGSMTGDSPDAWHAGVLSPDDIGTTYSVTSVDVDTASSVSRQHYIDTGHYLTTAETFEVTP